MALVPVSRRSGGLRRGVAAALATVVVGALGAVLPAASAHAAPEGQTVYVVNEGSNFVTAYDSVTKKVVATIRVGSGPLDVAVSPDGTQAYVTNGNSGSVSVIDTVTDTVVGTIPVGASPAPVAFSPDGAHAYVGASGNSVDVIDTATRKVTATIAVGATPRGIAVTPDGRQAYVANYGDKSVSVIDTASNTVTTTLVRSDTWNPSGVAISPDGKRAYVSNYNSDNVTMIDTATNTITAVVWAGSSPTGVAVSPDGQYLWVDNAANLMVTALDATTGNAIGQVRVGGAPTGIAVDPANGTVYVTNNTSATMSVIDPVTGNVLATVPTGSYPVGVAVSPPLAAVTGIAPNHGPAAGGTTVTLTGSNLTGTSAVTFDGTPASNVTVVNGTTVTATAPPHAGGTVNVALTAGHRTVAAGQYTYDAPAPVVTGVAPAHGPLAGGTSVTISGSNLTGATAVNFGSVAATSFTVVSDTQITATAPAGSAPGAVAVAVTTPGGTSTAGQYTYDVPAPVVTGVAPGQGPLAGGTSVTITGSNFTGATAVNFGSVAATSFAVVSDTQITATAPVASSVGAVDVTVTTPYGTSAVTAADGYGYQYPFAGFQAPVANPPAVNQMHAGRAVPIKFSLGGDQGLGILASGQPSVQQVDCSTGAAIGSPVPAATAGGSGLQYDAASGTYTWVWKTSSSYAGTCQVFTLGLNDGTTHTAQFRF